MQLHDELYERGLRILAFPCNQFGGQEPGTAADIRAFADGYGVKFQMFAKCNVNGERAHPVFRYLRSQLSDIIGSSIKWNFTKFLVDHDGIPRKRYSPPVPPLSLRSQIEKMLAAADTAAASAAPAAAASPAGIS